MHYRWPFQWPSVSARECVCRTYCYEDVGCRPVDASEERLEEGGEEDEDLRDDDDPQQLRRAARPVPVVLQGKSSKVNYPRVVTCSKACRRVNNCPILSQLTSEQNIGIMGLFSEPNGEIPTLISALVRTRRLPWLQMAHNHTKMISSK